MYIVPIGWMYVVTLMAATETNFVAGIVTFLFYGLLPCAVLVYLMGAKGRRIKRRVAEEAESLSQNAPMDAGTAVPDGEKTTGNP